MVKKLLADRAHPTECTVPHKCCSEEVSACCKPVLDSYTHRLRGRYEGGGNECEMGTARNRHCFAHISELRSGPRKGTRKAKREGPGPRRRHRAGRGR